ncbi:MAG: glycosyltransferase family 4 protein [Gammaproteobacteria bacterium]
MEVKVLHLRSSAGFYGAERVIMTLMKCAPNDNLDTTLACIENYLTHDQSLLKSAQAFHLPAIEIPCKSRIDKKTISHLVRFCKENKIDIIHSHDYKSQFYGIVSSKLVGCHQVVTLHGKTSGTIKNRVYELAENLFLRMVDHITVVSDPLYKDLSKTGLNKKLTQISNGVDDKTFNPDTKGFSKKHWGFDQSDFVFGTIARMSEEKGHRVLIKAFSKLTEKYQNIRLLLVGDGPLFRELMEMVRGLNLQEKVKFAGSQTEVERVLNDLDCYVSPSHTEAMPMSILEAMACALPVVATDVGSVGHLLRDDYGKLVPAGDVNALAKQMELIVVDKQYAKESGVNCRSRVEREFSAEIQSAEYSKIYRSVCAANQ